MISFLLYESSQNVTKKSQNLLKVLPKTVLFRNIALIFSLEKPCYLENRVVREPCKRRSACIKEVVNCTGQFFSAHEEQAFGILFDL